MVTVFFDTSVVFAAAYSSRGAARDLVRLAIEGKLTAIVSEDVLQEGERNVCKKIPEMLPVYREFMEAFAPRIVPAPAAEDIARVAQYTAAKDAPILAAAIAVRPDYFATYDRKHLLVPEVAQRSGLTIVTPDIVVRAIVGESTEPQQSDPG